MTLSAVGSSPDGDRRRDLRDRIGLVVGSGLAIAALLGSVLVMLRGGPRFVLDATVGAAAHRDPRPASSTTLPSLVAGPDDELAAPEMLARTPATAPPITISMVSMPVPGPGVGGSTPGPDSAGAAGGGGSGNDDEGGSGSVQVGTTPKPSPATTWPRATPAPTDAPPPPADPPATDPPPTAPPLAPPSTAPPTVPPTAPPTTVASGPQLSSSLACQPTAAGLRLDMFTGNGGEIRRVRITGFSTPACTGAHFTLKFLDGNGGPLMSASGTLKAPGPVSQTVYLDVAGLGGHNVKPSKVKKVDVKP